jgi:hypothetical protein
MNKIKIITVALFTIIIASPGVYNLLGPTNAEAAKAAAGFPDITVLLQEPKKFFSLLGEHASENILYEDELLELYSTLRFKLLKSSASKKAVIGKEGWLYFANGNGLRNAKGQDIMSDLEAQSWTDNIQKTAEIVEAYGGKFYVVIVPDKPQAYPEYLPDYIHYNPQQRRANKLMDVARENGLKVIDLLPTLLQNKKAERLYDKTDTHWTHEGAYLAYLEIHRHLQDTGLNLITVDKEHLREINMQHYSGDLARLLNLQTQFQENHKVLLAYTSYAQFDRKSQLLVLGDSFSGRLVDYWNYSFAKTSCQHHRWGNINNTAVADAKADVVLLMMVERGLQHPPQSHQISAPDCF